MMVGAVCWDLRVVELAVMVLGVVGMGLRVRLFQLFGALGCSCWVGMFGCDCDLCSLGRVSVTGVIGYVWAPAWGP